MVKSVLETTIHGLADARDSAVIPFVIPDEPILSKHLLKVQKCLAGNYHKCLDLVIHSSGGDIHVTYQLAELLRLHCERLTAIVPLYAKSAATLLTLAADELIMGELAELGPLDTQMLERLGGGKINYTSALNPFKTLEQLQRFCLETLDVTVKIILTRADLSVDEALKHAIEFASQVSRPLFAQLNTEKLGEYSRALAVGKEYGERLLRRYSHWNSFDEIDNVLEKLIRGYSSHDYIIDFKELKDLGFAVRLPDASEKASIEALVQAVLKTSQTSIFCISAESTFEQTAKKRPSEKEASDANFQGLEET